MQQQISLSRDFSKHLNNKFIRMLKWDIMGQTLIPLKSVADALNSASIWPLELFKYLWFKQNERLLLQI